VYATSAGSIAQDGLGRNGLFTSSLLNNLKTPGLEVKEIFNRTGVEVIRASDRKQIPAVYSQFFGSAYFSKPLVVPTPEAPQTAPSAAPQAAVMPSQPTETPETLSTSVANSVTITGSRSESGAGVTFTSVADFGEWLSRQPDNTVNTPYKVKLNVSSIASITNLLRAAPQKYVYLDLSGSTITTIPNHVFSSYALSATLTGIIIPDSIKSIGDYAFYYCTNLASVNIPNGVTSIRIHTFEGCTSLASITMPNSVTSIMEFAFSKCSSLTNLTIPNSVTSISGSAFYNCSSLKSIAIPDSVTYIGIGAFFNCSDLTNVTISNSITNIENRAFEKCYNLTSVTFRGTIPSKGFSTTETFPGDLRTKFYATNKNNGRTGTYSRASGGSKWTRL
jgi:hypothetical protein